MALTGPAIDVVLRNVVQGQESANHVDTTIVVYEKGFYAMDSTTGRVVVPADNANYKPLGFALNYWAIGSNPTAYRWNLQAEITLESPVDDTNWGDTVVAMSDNEFDILTSGDFPRVGKIVEILDGPEGRVVVQVSMDVLN